MAELVDFGPRVGADPEFFVTRKNAIIPVCGLIGGTKNEPIIIPDLVARPREIGNYAYQEDGVAYEFNVPAAVTAEHFQANITYCMEYIRAQLTAKDLGRKLSSGHKFKSEDLTHPMAMQIGCLKDNYAYKETDNGDFSREPFTASQLGNNRFCGGHIHVQYNYNNIPRNIFARLMDLFVGLPTIGYDKQKERRNFYGLPGIYRDKPYGIEYRTLSNFWLRDNFRGNPQSFFVAAIFSLAKQANTNPEPFKELYEHVPWTDVHKALKEEDMALANEILYYVSDKGIVNIAHTMELLTYSNTYSAKNGKNTNAAEY